MIEIHNSCLKVTNYHRDKSKELQKYLSVWDKDLHSVTWEAFNIDEESKVLSLPKISPFFVQNKLPKNVVENFEGDVEYKKAIFKMTVQPRNKAQAEAIEFLINTEEPRKMLCLKPGEGKTFCTINYLSLLKRRSIVIVDQDRVIEQWKESFSKFTNMKEEEIAIFSGINSVKEVLESKTDLNYKVYIASIKTLSSFANGDFSKINKLFEKIKIGVKVFDEAHVEIKNIVNIDMFTNIPITIYLTATPGRSNPMEDKIYQHIFKHCPKFDNKDSRKKRYHHVALVSYNTNPTTLEEAKCVSKRGFDINQYSKYLFDGKWKYVTGIIDFYLSIVKNKKCAIIIHNLKDIEKVKKYIEEQYPEKEIGLFCGLIKNNKIINKELEKEIILTTDKKFGKAVDVSDLRALLMLVPTSSAIVTEQMLGRLRQIEKKKVMYFDLTDEGFALCRKQRTKRKVVLKKFAKKFYKIKLDNHINII